MLTLLLTRIQQALRNQECGFCGKPLPSHKGEERDLICPDCLKLLGARGGDPLARFGSFQTFAAALFNARLKRVLYGYKFYGKLENERVLGEFLAQYWRCVSLDLPPASDVLVVPIPTRTDGKPLVSRFARRFARERGYEYSEDILSWSRETATQHSLTRRRQRFENLSGSLSVCGQTLMRIRPGAKMVVIVDDITTTGATLYEAHHAFRRCTAFEGRVAGLTLCQVPLAFHSRMHHTSNMGSHQ